MEDTVALAEEVVDETSTVWSDAIWDDGTFVNGTYAADFDEAILLLYAGYEEDGTLDQLITGSEEMETGIEDLKAMPEELQDNYELTYEIYSEAKPLIDLAINPEGSYLTFTDRTEELKVNTEDAFRDYEVLKVEANDVIDE